jgi:hypothetical protein
LHCSQTSWWASICIQPVCITVALVLLNEKSSKDKTSFNLVLLSVVHLSLDRLSQIFVCI